MLQRPSVQFSTTDTLFLVPRSVEPVQAGEQPLPDSVRDPLANTAMVITARRRPMSERLELALSWNAVAAELRAGLAAIDGRTTSSR
jgi:hypothetical protein